MSMTTPRRSRHEGAFRARITEERRPWGMFRVYPHHEAGSLKIITVRPGAALSLQYHRRRAEFWSPSTRASRSRSANGSGG